MPADPGPAPKPINPDPSNGDDWIALTIADITLTIHDAPPELSHQAALEEFLQLLTEEFNRNSKPETLLLWTDATVEHGSIIIKFKAAFKTIITATWQSLVAVGVIGSVDTYLEIGLKDFVEETYESAQASIERASESIAKKYNVEITIDLEQIPDEKIVNEARIALREKGYNVTEDPDEPDEPNPSKSSGPT